MLRRAHRADEPITVQAVESYLRARGMLDAFEEWLPLLQEIDDCVRREIRRLREERDGARAP